MTKDILVLGFGPVGKATVARLHDAGRAVRVAQRSRPADLPAYVPFTHCDILDPASLASALKGAAQVVLAIGFAYEGKIWERVWPRAMGNLLDVCAAADVRIVFLDNLYMYGPQTEPLREDMPLSNLGRKPATRTQITHMWQADKRVRVAALRAPDFYGPGVTLSHLGATGFAAMAQGKAATFVFPPDQPHDFAYVPDIGRAVVTLLDAPDDAFGQVWHMPCPPTRTSRELLAMGAEAAGEKLRVRSVPAVALSLLSPFASFFREMKEMRFQWDRPYRVDATKWRDRFWSDVTPHEVAISETISSFRY